MSTATEPAVKERPILFSGPMVREILDGRKTQTRRVVKEQPRLTTNTDASWHDPSGDLWRNARQYARDCCPYGVPGDRLWVRETWGMAATACGGEEVCYAADYPDDSDKAAGVVRHPSIHMPRDYSRITLEITDVRVQRLQSISEDDAIAEGIEYTGDRIQDGKKTCGSVSVVGCFRELWHTIHKSDGPNGWDASPWVWAITFRRK